jgi:hypothetical protein
MWEAASENSGCLFPYINFQFYDAFTKFATNSRVLKLETSRLGLTYLYIYNCLGSDTHKGDGIPPYVGANNVLRLIG